MAQSLSIADKIGIGLVSGLAATVVMTLGQTLEMRLTRRPPSKVPAQAAEKVSGVELAREKDETRASTAIHYAYGTALGTALAGLDRVREPGRTAAFFALTWVGGAAMLFGLKLARPPHRQRPAELATDLGHHLVYATSAGAVYSLLRRIAVRRDQ